MALQLHTPLIDIHWSKDNNETIFGQTSEHNSKQPYKGRAVNHTSPFNFQLQLLEGTESFHPLNGKMTLMTTIFFEEHSELKFDSKSVLLFPTAVMWGLYSRVTTQSLQEKHLSAKNFQPYVIHHLHFHLHFKRTLLHSTNPTVTFKLFCWCSLPICQDEYFKISRDQICS